MRTKLLLSALFGMAAWSLSSVAAADWVDGPCPQPHTGPAPCIETEINDNTYHFNGSGGHAGEWHGRPAAEGGGDFEFSSSTVDLSCTAASPSCNLTLSGQVKKCEDSNGNWRFGVKVTGAEVSAGDFLCNFITVSGFPWYSKESSITPHCPFEDDCDSFIPYDPNASTYTANFGAITVSASIVGTLVDGEHLHDVVFTPGNVNNPGEATFNFQGKTFFDCNDQEQDCSIDGILTLDNGTALEVY